MSTLQKKVVLSSAKFAELQEAGTLEQGVEYEINDFVPVEDVQINGTTIVTDGVAKIPYVGTGTYGVAKVNVYYGTNQSDGVLRIYPADTSDINGHTQTYRPIVPSTMDYAVKAALCDGKGAAWTSDEQTAARTRMGESTKSLEVTYDDDTTETITVVTA